MNADDWAENIFTSNDIEELGNKYEKILYNSENGVIVTIGISNEQCMEFCYHYNRSRSGTDVGFESYTYIESFLHFLASYLDDHLQEEGIDFKDDYDI
jgi:hypothetical protein